MRNLGCGDMEDATGPQACDTGQHYHSYRPDKAAEAQVTTWHTALTPGICAGRLLPRAGGVCRHLRMLGCGHVEYVTGLMACHIGPLHHSSRPDKAAESRVTTWHIVSVLGPGTGVCTLDPGGCHLTPSYARLQGCCGCCLPSGLLYGST